MSSSDGPRPQTLREFINLLAAVRERPHEYCRTLGELEELVASLYDLCATADGKADVLQRSLERLLAHQGMTDARELLDDHERSMAVVAGDATCKTLMEFWSQLDDDLGFPSPLYCCNQCRERLAQPE